MNKSNKIALTLLLLLLGTVSGVQAKLSSSSEAKMILLESSGRDPAKVYLPSDGIGKTKWPVILLLHGYAGSDKLIDGYFGFSNEVSRRGFILVVPNGKKDSSGYRYWNATAGCCDFDHGQSDDLAYLQELLAQVKRQFPVDENRVLVAGHSNGGFMAHRMACQSGAQIAAIVSFAGVVSLDPQDCGVGEPVSVLQIHALDDDTIRYFGDAGYPGLKPYPGVPETLKHWSQRNLCQEGPLPTGEINLTGSIPGVDTRTFSWAPCSRGAEIQLWQIQAAHFPWHFPHTPLLRAEFTERVLDFLLAAKLEKRTAESSGVLARSRSPKERVP